MNDVLLTVRGRLGRITLNRPKAINALSHGMLRRIADALTAWEHDERIRAVLIDGAGERGLCAGGDIRSIYDDVSSGGSAALGFWVDEYRLNARIGHYPKPYVALMDGLVMGGGVGVSAHGSVRVVTERSLVAMPEVAIGLVPDVGGTYLLSRMPGQSGTHIALTTARISGADAIQHGLADHYVPSGRLGALVDALGSGDERDPVEVVRSFAEPPPASALAAQAGWIDHCYAAGTVEEILGRLNEHGGPAAAAAEEIAKRSPTALKVTLRSLRSAAELPSLEAVLDQEYRVSSTCLRSHDLAEGIRAQVVDKDRRPRWSPAALAEVSDEAVASFFAPLGAGELGLATARVSIVTGQ
ncbi:MULTISPECIES: enoyl-CoA hydratase/isomerase family protein [unclassified Frankia]|uniref:enoyl-CoA hydratase/isomerase family protein n=1 Tax=unclassified Frankia TaxID=2632575 RepID=UPI002024D58F